MTLGLTPSRLPRRSAILGTLAFVLASCALLAVGSAGADSSRVENTNRVELVNVATNRRADVMWGSVQDGQNVFLWRNNRSAAQEFDLIKIEDNFFQIRARHSGKCLMLDKNQPKVGNGRRIAQYPCTPATYQSAQWSFEPMNGSCDDSALCLDRGWKIIKNRFTSRCLDTANPSGTRPREQAVVQLWSCVTSTDAWNADNQIWRIVDPATGLTVYQPR